MSSITMYSSLSPASSRVQRSRSEMMFGWTSSSRIKRISRSVCRASHSSPQYGLIRLMATLPPLQNVCPCE